MGILIDATKMLNEMFKDVVENEHPDKIRNIIYSQMDYIRMQPKAYDVDKVVEELDNYLFEKYCIEGDKHIFDIVKGGGVKK